MSGERHVTPRLEPATVFGISGKITFQRILVADRFPMKKAESHSGQQLKARPSRAYRWNSRLAPKGWHHLGAAPWPLFADLGRVLGG
jgi:Tfp pilus assembly PilM family ATPase